MNPYEGKRACCLLVAMTAAVLSISPGRSQPESGAEPRTGPRITGSAGIGFDSFRERYSIVEQDTLDSVNEFRTRLTLGILSGTILRDFFLIEGHAQHGDDTIDAGGRLRFTKRIGGGLSRIGFESDYSSRRFGDNSSYSFPNDYNRFFLRAYLKLALGGSFALRITERMEHQDYDRRTEFDYDYLRNRFSIGGEYEWDLTTSMDARLTVITMDIPDSTDIEYRSLLPSVEIRSFAGLYKRGFVQAAVERREYAAGSPRSDFWALLADAGGEWPFRPAFSVRLENALEWYAYDVKDEIYFDYVENRTALLFNLNHSYSLTIGGGPTYGLLSSGVSAEDAFREAGLKIVAEYNRGVAAWLSASYEPGKRWYDAFTPNPAPGELPSLFSDYTYHRLSLFANVRTWSGLTLSCFADYQPEDHEREGDDATATLFSVSLSYAF